MAVRQTVYMTATTGVSEVWQARIGHELASKLRADAGILGLDGRTDIVKAGLELLHRRAAEERMARNVDDYYGGAEPPLPLGILPADVDDAIQEDDTAGFDGRG